MLWHLSPLTFTLFFTQGLMHLLGLALDQFSTSTSQFAIIIGRHESLQAENLISYLDYTSHDWDHKVHGNLTKAVHYLLGAGDSHL
jgi:predicted RND superfamily exporter protein